MNGQHYAFKVGEVECSVLLDGASVIGAERMMRRFPAGSEAEYRRAYADIGLAFDEADSSMNILLLRLGSAAVLVDSGEGGRPKGGGLPASLRLAGLTPDAVTLVVITHTHDDHVFGLLSESGAPLFPNATYVIAQQELAFWQSRVEASAEADPDGGATQRAILAMLRSQGLRVIDLGAASGQDAQILPGLSAVPAVGHTPGHMALRLESGGESLLVMGDLLHSPMQFAHPEWSPRFDADPAASVPTRRRLLGRAADEGALALFYHLTFPGLGRVRRAGAGFLWQSVLERGV
jgi:glyoxylase-like metal-dependent hydrolase (beta-lactamase superfamily II)